MTLLGIQQRFREIGRIRSGVRVLSKGGKVIPTSLDTWRFTSQDRGAIDAVAAVYGGQVAEWDKGGWEVITESDTLNVMLPPKGPGDLYSLNYELWAGGGLQRRCDGVDAIIGGEESVCICDPDDRKCLPTLRVSLILPDLPGLGTWRLESKGYNAAAELPGSLNLLAAYSAQGVPIRGVLRLEKRSVKRVGQPQHDFVVQTLDVPYSINELLARAPALPAGEVKMLTNDASGSDEQANATEADAATTPTLTTEQIAARYAYGERYGFDHAAFDAAAVDAMGAGVAVLDDATWRAFAITVKGGAIAPSAAPAAPGGAEVVSEPSEVVTTWTEAQDEPDPLAARIARAEKRAKGEKP